MKFNTCFTIVAVCTWLSVLPLQAKPKGTHVTKRTYKSKKIVKTPKNHRSAKVSKKRKAVIAPAGSLPKLKRAPQKELSEFDRARIEWYRSVLQRAHIRGR